VGLNDITNEIRNKKLKKWFAKKFYQAIFLKTTE